MLLTVILGVHSKSRAWKRPKLGGLTWSALQGAGWVATHKSQPRRTTVELAFLLEFVAPMSPMALLVAPPIVMARLLAPGSAESLATLFAIPVDSPHPRGVQEEEPVKWRLERLQPRRAERRPEPLRKPIPSFDARQSGCRALRFRPGRRSRWRSLVRSWRQPQGRTAPLPGPPPRTRPVPHVPRPRAPAG